MGTKKQVKKVKADKLIKVSKDTHRDLKIRAAKEGVSIGSLVNELRNK